MAVEKPCRRAASRKLSSPTSKRASPQVLLEAVTSGVELEITHSPVSGERYGAAW